MFILLTEMNTTILVFHDEVLRADFPLHGLLVFVVVRVFVLVHVDKLSVRHWVVFGFLALE